MSVDDRVDEVHCPFVNGECTASGCVFYITEKSECLIRYYLAGECGVELPDL